MATSKRNRHHLAFPRRAYTTPLEKRFRGLPCLIIWMDAEVHRWPHATIEPPKKPSIDEMKFFIERHKTRECGCY